MAEYNIENDEGILIQEKGNRCSKLKKGKLKTEKLLKITNVVMLHLAKSTFKVNQSVYIANRTYRFC